MRNRVKLPWPAVGLWPNNLATNRGHLASLKRKAHDDGYWSAYYNKPDLPETGEIPIKIIATPPSRRTDDDNLIAALKKYRDGMAEALGVNDDRFRVKGVEFNKPEKPGHVIIDFLEVGE